MIKAVHGVLLDAEDCAALLDALEVFEQILAERDSRPSAKLTTLHARLTRAHTRVSPPDTRVGASKPVGQSDSGVELGYELVDSARAARLLGITADGVRDLARRGRLPAVRAGGRWLFPAAAVVARAERR